MKESDRASSREVAYAVARSLGLVSAVFSIVVAVFLTMNLVRRGSTPLQESPTLERLRMALRENPEDAALQEELRSLDTLARRAFFTSIEFAVNGAVLLCVGVILCLASFKAMSSIRKRDPQPGKFSAEGEVGVEEQQGRRAVVVVALLAVVAGVAVALTVRSRLEPAGPAKGEETPSEEEILRNWPGFRGPYGLGIAYCTNVPLKWDMDTGENVLWEAKVPMTGFSSPVVWGNHLFITSADRKVLAILCYNTETGEVLWRRDVPETESGGKRPKVTDDTGYAAATMATDGRRAFAIFATGDLICTDFDGNILWQQELGTPKNMYGHASSLITAGGMLYVQYDDSEDPRLVAVDVESGDIEWETLRDVKESWASPIVVDIEGNREVILHALPSVAGYDPRTGAQKWSLDYLDGGEVASSPAYAGGIVYVATEHQYLVAFRPGTEPQILWKYDEDLPSVSSPVAAAGCLFLANAGVVTCFDLKTGEVHWVQEYDTEFYSSPVYVEGRVYLIDRDGLMRVFAADKEFKLLASCKLPGKSECTPAFVGGRIYVRGYTSLWCFGK